MVRLKVINTRPFAPSVTGNALPIGIVTAELSALGLPQNQTTRYKVCVGQVRGHLVGGGALG